MAGLFIGADIGGTNVKVGLVNEEGELLAASQIVTLAESGPEQVIDRVFSDAQELLSKSGFAWRNVKGVGVGCAGLIRASTSVLVTSPNLPNWENN